MLQELTFQLATKDDLVDIVRMLSDDTLGSSREKFDEVLSENYAAAFERIEQDPNQELTVAEMNGEMVATHEGMKLKLD